MEELKAQNRSDYYTHRMELLRHSLCLLPKLAVEFRIPASWIHNYRTIRAFAIKYGPK